MEKEGKEIWVLVKVIEIHGTSSWHTSDEDADKLTGTKVWCHVDNLEEHPYRSDGFTGINFIYNLDDARVHFCYPVKIEVCYE